MSINKNVLESLVEADGNLRNALFWSAKNEKPYVSSTIVKLISEIDNLIKFDKFSDKCEEHMKNSGNDFFRGIF